MNQVSLVEQLKEVLKAQNESLRQKHNETKTLRAENSRLTGLVQELEIENEGLKGLLVKYQTDSVKDATEIGQSGSASPRPRYDNVFNRTWYSIKTYCPFNVYGTARVACQFY